MKIDTDELKDQAKKEVTKLADFAKKQTKSFQKNQWPTIKAALEDGAKKLNNKADGKKFFEKSKKIFKDGVRALDQKVNGSSVHRDDREDK